MGRPKPELSRWNPALTLVDNAAALSIQVTQAYYMANRYALKFVHMARGIKPGTVLKKKDRTKEEAPLMTFSDPAGMESSMTWEGAD